ncbi:hypothetical protein GBF38_007640 [Nibea albiflora]|uniref:Uncharacterized protein n=1 Tax=Nibea albiflora TaxID=240163 RepID=A0ACB7EM14_NIBAL|nr:hypothetical protein GBF38_007640 [Nibea albiflora]
MHISGSVVDAAAGSTDEAEVNLKINGLRPAETRESDIHGHVLTSPPQPALNSQHFETFALLDEEGNVLN